MKLAVFLPNWIGDAVMATPALRAIRNHFADAEIVAVLRPYVADVLAGTSLMDRQILCASKSSRAGERGLTLVRTLRRERFDTIVLLPNSFRSAWLAWLSGAERRIGFDRDGRGWLLTDRIAPKAKALPYPVIDEYLRLAEYLGCAQQSRDMELTTTAEDERRYREFWIRHSEDWDSKGIVCLNPGGAFGSAKHWPIRYFADLARRIVVDLDKSVLILCGPAERSMAREIVGIAAHARIRSLAEIDGGLGLTKAAIRHSQLLITTDSGPRHFAPPFGVPVVTLFGPTHMAWSETFYSKAVHLQLPLECGPCQKRTCPLGHHRCMCDLSVDRVFTEVARILDPAPPIVPAA